MKLDVRLAIGLMFTIIGVAVAGYGLTSNPAIYDRSLGINVNLWWGLVLLAFGVGMLGLATWAERKRRRGHAAASSTPAQPE